MEQPVLMRKLSGAEAETATQLFVVVAGCIHATAAERLWDNVLRWAEP